MLSTREPRLPQPHQHLPWTSGGPGHLSANITECKSAFKKTSASSRKEQRCILPTKLTACTAGSSASQGASLPGLSRSAVAELLSQAVTLLPNPQQNMDDDSAALALVSPGPAKGHVFPCECCMAPLTALGPVGAWAAGGAQSRASHTRPGHGAKRAGLQAPCDAPLHITAKAVLDRELQRHIWAEGMH